ncbi:MAG: hypothetical protein ACYCSN_09250 [Acidobacteriaceae bacterium]
MRKRSRFELSLLIALVVVLALVTAVVLRKKAPPECARLLPESDGIVYVALKPVRLATHFDRTPVHRDPDYQQFINATGFVFERDLDEVAFAIHRLPDPHGPNGPVAYSEVFSGRFDGPRLTKYLASVSTSHETYLGHDIYDIPVEGRTLRVAILGYDLVAASNMPTPEQIHSILDRYHTAALPFSGPSLLAEQYSSVPLLSVAWGIGRIGLPFSDKPDGTGNLQLMGLTLPFAADAPVLASLRFIGSLRLRVEETAPSEAAAANSAESLKTLLSIFQTLQQNMHPDAVNASDEEFRQIVNSVRIDQKNSTVVLRATIPLDVLKKTLASSPQQASLPTVP